MRRLQSHTVNQCLDIEQYPLPKIDDLYANLQGGERFTILDLSEAFLQMELDEGSRKYLVVNTHRGLFRYKRLPFGVSSAGLVSESDGHYSARITWRSVLSG